MVDTPRKIQPIVWQFHDGLPSTSITEAMSSARINLMKKPFPLHCKDALIICIRYMHKKTITNLAHLQGSDEFTEAIEMQMQEVKCKPLQEINDSFLIRQLLSAFPYPHTLLMGGVHVMHTNHATTARTLATLEQNPSLKYFSDLSPGLTLGLKGQLKLDEIISEIFLSFHPEIPEELNARLVEHRRIRQETPEAEGAYLHAWRRTEQYLEYIA